MEENKLFDLFFPTPIMPFNLFQNENNSDKNLIDGLRTGAYAAGARGEEVEMAVEEGLKKLGRKDLLPPCCR